MPPQPFALALLWLAAAAAGGPPPDDAGRLLWHFDAGG